MVDLPTLHEFLDNPMGRGSNALTSRKLIKDDLERRYLKLMERKKDQFKIKIYKKKEEYYFHITIPSETERDNDYDTVIHFTPPEATKEYAANSNSIKDYKMRIFSNSPSFVYTYAYTVNLFDFMVYELKGKYKDIVLKQKPVVRNPYEVVSYEKTITFAMFHILYKGLLMKSVIDTLATKYDAGNFVKSIREEDKIKIEIKQAENKLKKKKSSDEDKRAAQHNKARKDVSHATNRPKLLGNRDAKLKTKSRGKREAKPKRVPRAKR